MGELILEILVHWLINAACYVPGLCIAILTGNSPQDFSEGAIVMFSLAFWSLLALLGFSVWAVFQWIVALGG